MHVCRFLYPFQSLWFLKFHQSLLLSTRFLKNKISNLNLYSGFDRRFLLVAVVIITYLKFLFCSCKNNTGRSHIPFNHFLPMANILHNYSQYQNQIHETDTIHETYSDFLTFTHTHLYVSMQVCRSRLLPPQSRLGSFKM